MSKKHYIIVLIMLIAGIAASLLLIPQPQDIAQMEMKDKLFAQAQQIYEQELAKGDLSIGVVSQVTELYVQGGAIDKAIALMEKFVAEHPDNVEARERLGQYYQYAQRPADYTRNLEETNAIAPSAEATKKLADIYQFNTEYDKQIRALQSLINNPQTREPKHYLELANLQASQKDYAGAIATLGRLKQENPGAFGFKEEQFLVTLLYDQQQHDAAFDEAKRWIAANRQPDDAATLIGIVHKKDKLERAGELLATYTDEQILQSQPLLEESILLQVALGKEDEAYARLKGLGEKQWSPVLLEQLLLLASTHGDKELVASVLPRIKLTTLNETQLARIAEAATIYRDANLLKALVDAFPENEYGNSYPLLSALLAVSEKRPTADQSLARLDNLTLVPEQQLQVARVCLRYDRPACTESFLSKLPEQDKLTDNQIASVGETYLQLKQWDKGNAYILEALKTRDSDQIRLVGAKYAAVAGDEPRLAEWLVAKGDSTPMASLRDVYFTAMNAGHYKSGLLVAKTQYEKEKTELTRRDLANAYIKLGQYADAVATLRPAAKETLVPEDEDAYVSSLAKLSKNKQYRSELATYASLRLKQNPPRKQKLTLIYALVNTGQAGVAMPYIRDLALKEGGQWAALYAEQLDKQGKHDEARDFWVKVAGQKSTSEKERTAIAYGLLERGYKKDAEKIFKLQAEKAKPDSQAVAALLYIWGPRANAEQVKWLTGRYAQTNDAKEKAQWAALIAQYSAADTLADAMRAEPSLIKHKPVLEAYLQVLADEGKFAGSEKEFIENAKTNGETDLLKSYARVARENGYNEEARRAYEALVALNPKDSASLREAGLIAFEQADYSSSKEYLGSYLQDGPAVAADQQAYRALYNYGEIAERGQDKEEAMRFYRLSYRSIEDRGLNSAEALSLKAQSQIVTGKEEEGLATYRAAMNTYPNDEVLKADYIASLIQMKRYDDARTLLEQRQQSSSLTPQLDAAVPVIGGDVAGYTLLNHDREALVRFNKPVDRGVSITEASLKQTPWVAYSTQGYDAIRIVAKPGYRLAADDKGNLRGTTKTGDAARETQLMAMRYDLLAARLDLETGRVYDAASRMETMTQTYPKDAQVLGFAANAENYGGNWPEALALLDEAQGIAPRNEDVANLKQSIRRLHAPEAKADFEYVRRGDSDEYITTLSGMTPIDRHWQLGAQVQNNYADATNVRRVNGQVGNFSGHRQQAELFARYHDQPGVLAQLSLFTNNASPGVGGYLQFLNPLGQTQFIAEYRRPYWEYTQAVLDDAMRSRAAVLHTVRPATNLSITAGPGINRYDTDDKKNVKTTASADLDVVYRFHEVPYYAIGYSFDGEYTLNQKKGVDSTGAYTPLFPLRTREIHFVSLRGLWDLGATTYAEGMIGWGIDRFGGNGAAIEGKITHEFTESLDGQLRAYYGIDSSDTDNNLGRVGGYVRWRF